MLVDGHEVPVRHASLVVADAAELRRWASENPAVHAGARSLDVAIVPLAGGPPDPRRRGILACLRDLAAVETWVLPAAHHAGPAHDDWPRALLGLGFARSPWPLDDPEPPDAFRFALADYKPAPTWFGPRDWANPEMWDKARW